jgi:hypothetical protein
MGGTITSTLAGEFSFEIALAFALLFLGTFAMALDRRGALWVPAVLFAATVMSHLVVGVFAVYAGGVLWLLHRPLRNATRAAAIVAVGGLLTAVWALPLAATLGYTTDMRYEPIGSTLNGAASYLDWMFLSEMWFLFPLVVVAIVAAIVFRRRGTRDLVAIGLAAGLVFYGWEGLRAVLGKAPAWNLRLLPFWYLSLYLVAGVGAAEIVRFVARFAAWVGYGTEDLAHDPDPELAPATSVSEAGIPPSSERGDGDGDVRSERSERRRPRASVSEAGIPPSSERGDGDGDVRSERSERRRPRASVSEAGIPPSSERGRVWVRAVSIGLVATVLAVVALVRINDTRGYVTYWAKYNYTGYQGGSTTDATAKSYAEYKAFIDTAKSLPPGRLLWEGTDGIGAYGTPLALMLLPYWTDGRISSMEGLYYESSATTPYHFMAAATLMLHPSNPVRGLPYRTLADFDLGVRYLQLMGVRYFAATSPEVKQRADASPELRAVATVPDLDHKAPDGWTIYEVADAPVVSPLSSQPVVVDGMHADANWKCEDTSPSPPGTPDAEFDAWDCTAVPWFNDPAALDRVLTTGGPSSWQHASPQAARGEPRVGRQPVQVTDIRSTDDTVSFDVSRTGVPVLVKTSYFPNWEARGAKGPWRATPDFMVVVPTSHHVELVYGTTTAEWLGRVATVLGFVGLGLLVWWGRRARAGSPDRAGEDEGDPGAGDGVGNTGGRRRRRPVRFPVRSRPEVGS